MFLMSEVPLYRVDATVPEWPWPWPFRSPSGRHTPGPRPRMDNFFTEMCSGPEAGSYLRLIDFVYHSTLGLGEIKKKDLSGLRLGHLAVHQAVILLVRLPLPRRQHLLLRTIPKVLEP